MDSFLPIAEILFNVPNRDVSDLLFKSMDKDKSGSLTASEIILAIRNIMDIYCPPPPVVVLKV